jgi:hypothetical protein
MNKAILPYAVHASDGGAANSADPDALARRDLLEMLGASHGPAAGGGAARPGGEAVRLTSADRAYIERALANLDPGLAGSNGSLAAAQKGGRGRLRDRGRRGRGAAAGAKQLGGGASRPVKRLKRGTSADAGAPDSDEDDDAAADDDADVVGSSGAAPGAAAAAAAAAVTPAASESVRAAVPPRLRLARSRVVGTTCTAAGMEVLVGHQFQVGRWRSLLFFLPLLSLP